MSDLILDLTDTIKAIRHKRLQKEETVLTRALTRIEELERRPTVAKHNALQEECDGRMVAIKKLEAVVEECGCQGEWCGKSPTQKDSGLCAVCEYEKKHATKEVTDE